MAAVLFENAHLFDGVGDALRPAHVLVEGAVIREVSETPISMAEAVRIDVAGRTLMPGLIDAHVHAYCPEVDPARGDRMPMTLVAHRARRMLEDSARRGFTSVRDCGGGDHGLFQALERGWIKGPRLFYCGRALSQTGGHGDGRARFEACACGHMHEAGYQGHLSRTVDGPENLRLAVREELRRGASFIKIMGSGGVASPSDPIHLAQYSADEIGAVVDEAERHEVYVTAHVHPDAALRRCIELGVGCIEHGTLISAETAALAAEKDVPVVPTLAVIKALARHGAELGFPRASLDKLAEIEPVAIGAVERLKRAGARIGFGTDLIGPLDRHQCLEFELRREVLSPAEILRSATSGNAAILGAGDRIGRIAEGFLADLIVVDGDPLSDIGLFQDDGRNVPIVMKAGAVLKGQP
ncbi:MAG TPA: amidohydrolase family protein [Caulobacteraceae bacterium]